MTDIRPDIWEAMLKIPGWLPPTEATVLRAIMELRAKVLSYTQVGMAGDCAMCILAIGQPSDDDLEAGAEMLDFFLERKLTRIRARRAKARRPVAPTDLDHWADDGGAVPACP